MKEIFLVAVGGGLGAVVRYQIGLWMLAASQSARFPLGTLVVNVLGCLAVGLVWAWTDRMSVWSEELRLALMIGLFGGFTTFSAFGLETVLMIKRGALGLAGIYVAASLLLGGLSVWAGIWVANLRA